MFDDVPVTVKPEVVEPGQFELGLQPKPTVAIPTFVDESSGQGAGSTPIGEAGPAVSPTPDVRPPSLSTPDARVNSLIAGCYPSVSRRFAEEGRVVAKVVIGVDGRAVSWAVDERSGFRRLDAASECVVRRLEFVAGRRDGRAVEATVRLPILFELR